MKDEKEQTVIDKTLIYLENYREMERYIREAVSETSQIPDIGKYNISAENAFLQTVKIIIRLGRGDHGSAHSHRVYCHGG